jgi:hypothetical protein
MATPNPVRPISAGDMCCVISGMTGAASPNIGLIVEVIHRVYDCPQLGVLWRCKADYAVLAPNTGADKVGSLVPGGLADFAQSWLKRIEPEALPPKALEKLATA